jgi:hypothetical protein
MAILFSCCTTALARTVAFSAATDFLPPDMVSTVNQPPARRARRSSPQPAVNNRAAPAVSGVRAFVRSHWSAIENGTHYRGDVTLGEDACRTAHRSGTAVLASLHNLTNGLYELERERERTQVDSLKSWCQQQTFSTV